VIDSGEDRDLAALVVPRSTIHLGLPGFPDIARRTITTPGKEHQ
jgi:hypothetical protein